MDSNKAEIEAGSWLARVDGGDLSRADLEAFEQWKEADPRHGAAYARLAATWQALDRLRAVRPGASEPILNDFFRDGVRRPSLDSFQSPVKPPAGRARTNPLGQRASLRLRLRLAVAASILVAIGGLWIASAFKGTHTFSTSVGGFQRIALEDQSTVYLNTDSEVRIALSARVRKVELVRGEASFDVAHDVTRPFIVSAGKTAVRAVGTKFDVRRLDNAVEVIVDEGKVVVGEPTILESSQIDVPSTMLRVSAGQSALSSGSAVKLAALPKDSLNRKLAWQNQMLVFDGDSRAEVVAQFNRYNERQLVIADPALSSLRIGGYFRPTNLDAFISVLQSDFGINVKDQGYRLVLATAAH
jgi:transmembrane sensor